MTDRQQRQPSEPSEHAERPATNMGETTGGARPEVIGRDGDTIVQDSITTGRPVEGSEAPDVDRRAP
jgi:hypothetical protein